MLPRHRRATNLDDARFASIARGAGLDQFEQGDIIRVRYRHQAGNGRRSEYAVTAAWLGFHRGRSEFDLNLRPLAGTMSLRTEDVVRASLVAPAASRSGRREDVDGYIHLPRRIASAR